MLDLAGEVERPNDHKGLLAHKDTVLAALPDLKPRAKTVLELIDLAQFIYASRPLEIEEKAKKHLNAETRPMILEITAMLAGLPDWSAGNLGEAVRTFAEAKGLKLGKVAPPLRVALTGRAISPGVFEVMALLGKKESLARLADQQ